MKYLIITLIFLIVLFLVYVYFVICFLWHFNKKKANEEVNKIFKLNTNFDFWKDYKDTINENRN
jgi:hypothetical protein